MGPRYLRDDGELLASGRPRRRGGTAGDARVVSSTRKDLPWTNSHRIADDLRTGVQKLKDATPDGVLVGSGKLAAELDRLDLIDEYKLLVHPRIAGHGPTLYESGLPSARRLELISANPLHSGAVAMHYRRAR